jgi:hypothetical protein
VIRQQQDKHRFLQKRVSCIHCCILFFSSIDCVLVLLYLHNLHMS